MFCAISGYSKSWRACGAWTVMFLQPVKLSSARKKLLRENGLYFEFSLCFTQACLGKVISSSTKSGKDSKKKRFFALPEFALAVCQAHHQRRI